MVVNDKNKAPFDQLLKLTKDREIFQNISQAKKEFVAILSLVGNGVTYDKLDGIHENHKGIKISQGNELQNCPYQVLDIVRDFDINLGLNIRALHWWGRGAYLLVYLGTDHPMLQVPYRLLQWIKNNSYDLTNTKLFDYKQIIDEGQIVSSEKLELKQLIDHLSSGKPFQIIKEIPVKDKLSLEKHLGKEVEKVLNWMNLKNNSF
ncbi:hypothetical protein CQA01_22970 [Cyclobacterium qasimii]|uniref:Uncharacterized protein n=1 Tax=Cyclobacterium qasimii TaxID=1350429 RepID=A0A512CC25_9BACT|nr:hypothetical protein CQA01_22970 [Cyclobacterium qasimii]